VGIEQGFIARDDQKFIIKTNLWQ